MIKEGLKMTYIFFPFYFQSFPSQFILLGYQFQQNMVHHNQHNIDYCKDF